MAKPQPIRVPADDCLVTVGDEQYAVHEGEWVEVLPVLKARDMQALNALSTVGDRMAVAQGDANESVQVAEILDGAFADVAALLADRVRAWNWTDMDGMPLPQPYGRVDVITSLTTDEMFYLVTLVRGDGIAQRKKDSAVWQTTYSDSAPAPIPNGSASVHSLTPAI